MNALLRFFTNDQFIPPNQAVNHYLSNIGYLSSKQLPIQYNSQMIISIQKCQKPHEFLTNILLQLQKQVCHSSVLKLLTLLHTFVIVRNYDKQDCRALQQFEISKLNLVQNQEQKWFFQLYRCYMMYLIKLPSLSEVYVLSTNKNAKNIDASLHLTHIFGITNTISVLFPSLSNAVNVIGRYQANKHADMKELFIVLSQQLVRIYGYIKYLCDQILKQYRIFKANDLRCYLQCLPQLELLCDKIEDILVNKYFKGKRISLKVQFKEEKIAEVKYYLDTEHKIGGNKRVILAD